MEPKVQVLILIDATKSMEPFLTAVKSQTITILKSIPYKNIHTSVIAYRDYGDEERFFQIPYTQDLTYLQSQLNKIQPIGGSDDAEDVATALFLAQRNNPNITNQLQIIFHIADFPAHGTKFHKTLLTDRFPNGDPDGHDPLRSIRYFAANQWHYYFLRIQSETDTMIDLFRTTYFNNAGPRFLEFNLILPATEAFQQSFYTAITSSIDTYQDP